MAGKCSECGAPCPECSSAKKHGGNPFAKKKGKKVEPKKDKGKKPSFGKKGKVGGGIAEDIFSGPDTDLAE